MKSEGLGVAKLISLMTAAEAAQLPSGLRWELIDGVLIEMPPVNHIHARIAANIAALLHAYVRAHHLGAVYVEPGYILRRDPVTIRAPDVAFIRAERIPAAGEPSGFWETVPDLAVEVVSPGDTSAEIQAKVREWIEAGVRQLWVVYPASRTVQRIASLRERQELGLENVLEAGDVIPGFSCRVAELFE